MFEPLFEAALSAATPPAAVALSFGDPQPWLDRAKGRRHHDVPGPDPGRRRPAVDAGADVLVVQGTEAGGHTGTMSLLPFLAAASRWPDVPLLAAGGIANGRTLAAALTAGADGAWLGTAFMATPEAVEVSDLNKELNVASDGGDTVLTRAYDIVAGWPWPPGISMRAHRNRFTDEWAGREAELEGRREEIAETPSDPGTDMVLYGQSAAFVGAVRPAADVVHTVCQEGESILRARARRNFWTDSPEGRAGGSARDSAAIALLARRHMVASASDCWRGDDGRRCSRDGHPTGQRHSAVLVQSDDGEPDWKFHRGQCSVRGPPESNGQGALVPRQGCPEGHLSRPRRTGCPSSGRELPWSSVPERTAGGYRRHSPIPPSPRTRSTVSRSSSPSAATDRCDDRGATDPTLTRSGRSDNLEAGQPPVDQHR